MCRDSFSYTWSREDENFRVSSKRYALYYVSKHIRIYRHINISRRVERGRKSFTNYSLVFILISAKSLE